MTELDIASLRTAFQCVAEDLSRGSSLKETLSHAVRRVSLRQTQQILERLSADPIPSLQSLPLPRTTLDFLATRAGLEVTDWVLFFRQLAERTTELVDNPTSQHPHDPPLWDMVDHWLGNVLIGSVVPGRGRIVKPGNKWQRYRDHGDHAVH